MSQQILETGLNGISDTALALIEMFRTELGNESLILHSNVNYKLFDEDGLLKQEENVHNLICTAGKDKLVATSSMKYIKDFAYIAIGTNATAANAADTTLGTETARSLATLSNPDAHTYQAQVTFAAGTGTGTVTESGLLDAASTGNLLTHQVFSGIAKAAGDSLQVTWSIT